MGSAQSVLTPQTTAAALVVAGAVVYGYAQYGSQQAPASGPGTTSSKKGKKKKQAGAQSDTAGADSAGSSKAEAVTPQANVVSFPPVVPGDFDAPATTTDIEPTAKTSKSKKKKGKKASTPAGGVPRAAAADALSDSSATAPESSSARPSATRKKNGGIKASTVPHVDTEESWTRVEPRRRTTPQQAVQVEGSSSAAHPREVSTSDAGVTTSVTDNSSPIAERTEDDENLAYFGGGQASENRKTLAEKLLPRPRKTGVDDMLETSDYPTLSRVIRIPPRPGEKPATGFTWGDYEDVDDSRITADDADGEDDGGWGVVKSRSRSRTAKSPTAQTPTQTAPETITKKQRQRAAKRDAEKAAKAEADAERLAILAQHKRDLERERMAEQSKSKKTSGGMSAYVDENGKLVWQ
ncbi:hypothetical protein OBBRIDRAFT_787464 [Obba rivulosa]|uniref:Uncharacterized protein n=1 Tax=Obba rivulosa TaxID=1052685 RepID=A0A8E2DVN4_9APHY|nr:hypothetical protein OBBRIDRAFT_787464 [Obba rivulosa]